MQFLYKCAGAPVSHLISIVSPRLLLQETEMLTKDPVPGISAAPFEDNLRYFNVVLEGPPETPYAGAKPRCEASSPPPEWLGLLKLMFAVSPSNCVCAQASHIPTLMAAFVVQLASSQSPSLRFLSCRRHLQARAVSAR